jgi:hypothetical protein
VAVEDQSDSPLVAQGNDDIDLLSKEKKKMMILTV